MAYQDSGMLSRDQLIYLFDRFALLTSQPEFKKRIADAVSDKQEAVAVTTAIQEEIFLEMGVGRFADNLVPRLMKHYVKEYALRRSPFPFKIKIMVVEKTFYFMKTKRLLPN